MTFSTIDESGRSLIASYSAYLGFALFLYPAAYSNNHFIGDINIADTYWWQAEDFSYRFEMFATDYLVTDIIIMSPSFLNSQNH